MQRRLLESVDLPNDLKSLSNDDMSKIAHEVRDIIIEVVSKNGGHLSAGLGVVELTIALLGVMDVPTDKIVWDVGHQCYAYKILTDRLKRFETLRKRGGISGFPKPSESVFDCFATGHATTAISAALGMAQARDLAGQRYKVTAIIGDGSLSGGMAWEAINNAGASKADLLVILNDNKMSISPSTGALAAHIANLRAMPLYRSVENTAHKVLSKMPFAGNWMRKAGQVFKRGLTNWVSPTSGTIFEALGFEYFGPIDGHDIGQLRHFITQARNMKGPVLLHVVTRKGKGYHKAEHKPGRYHGIAPFNTRSGKVSAKAKRTYTDVFGSTLVELARLDPRIVAITAAMPDGTGLTHFARKYPKRFFNVGIAEQHAVTFAAGQACAGAKPVVAIYSTFLQRAYDQIVHDVCLQNLPVVFALDRGGIVGEDGPTHHGVFDLSYLRHIPNLTLMVPKDGSELPDMLLTALSMNSPVALRYPRGEARKTQRAPIKRLPVGKSELLRNGSDVAIIAVGPMVACAMNAAAELERLKIQARVINARFVKPLDQAAIISAASECGAVVLAEENAGQGGFSSAVLECMAKNHALPETVEIVALPDSFLEHGKSPELRETFGLSTMGILDAVNRAILRLSQHDHVGQGEEFVIRQSI